MGWFTAKDAPSDEPVRGKTISDKAWKALQARARSAHPERDRFGSDQNVKAARQGRDNYRNRHRN
jgi:hypothetical protein